MSLTLGELRWAGVGSTVTDLRTQADALDASATQVQHASPQDAARMREQSSALRTQANALVDTGEAAPGGGARTDGSSEAARTPFVAPALDWSWVNRPRRPSVLEQPFQVNLQPVPRRRDEAAWVPLVVAGVGVAGFLSALYWATR